MLSKHYKRIAINLFFKTPVIISFCARRILGDERHLPVFKFNNKVALIRRDSLNKFIYKKKRLTPHRWGSGAGEGMVHSSCDGSGTRPAQPFRETGSLS